MMHISLKTTDGSQDEGLSIDFNTDEAQHLLEVLHQMFEASHKEELSKRAAEYAAYHKSNTLIKDYLDLTISFKEVNECYEKKVAENKTLTEYCDTRDRELAACCDENERLWGEIDKLKEQIAAMKVPVEVPVYVPVEVPANESLEHMTESERVAAESEEILRLVTAYRQRETILNEYLRQTAKKCVNPEDED
jgi:predicted nuclease with TOPRIM domain